MNTQPHSGARDFDFLHGDWTIHNRRLAARLCGSTDWREFEAKLSVRPILGGLGNVDEFTTVIDGRPMEAATLRVFSPTSGQWSLYWVDNWTAELQPPLVGAFTDGVGEFFTHDRFEGREIIVRFIWCDITERSARWEQAFSEDEGKTWEANWVMEFVRPA